MLGSVVILWCLVCAVFGLEFSSVTWIWCSLSAPKFPTRPHGAVGRAVSRGLPDCLGPPGVIVSCFFCSSLPWLVQGKCFRSEWLLGCRVFLSVPNSWCWRLNGAAWEGGKGSRKPICYAEKGLFFQKILILQRGELVWTVAGLLVMPKVSDS